MFRNKGEWITFYLGDNAGRYGWFEVTVALDGTGADIKDFERVKGYIKGFFRYPAGYCGIVLECKEVVCKPSVRTEVEQVFKDFMLLYGLDMRPIIKENHTMRIGYGSADTEYDVTFEGVPDKGEAKYLLKCDQQDLDFGVWKVDVKQRDDMVRTAVDIIERYLATSH